jgi:hypothetical protein
MVAIVALLTMSVSAPAHATQPPQRATQPPQHVTTPTLTAFVSLVDDERTLATEISIADNEITTAQQVLADSSGKTLDENARTALSSQIATATAKRSNAAAQLQAWKELNAIADDHRTTAQLLALRRPVTLSVDLSEVADVTAAVTAWNAEQARLAAEAAQAAAAGAAQPNNSTVSSATSGDSVDKASIAEGIFARYGFSNYVFDGGQTRGHYGATDMNNQVIYMQLSIIPTSRVASVALHEYQHILQAREYGGYAGAVAHFGSVAAMESAADCGALAAGATWVAYGCH